MIKRLRWRFVLIWTGLSLLLLSLVLCSSYLSTKSRLEADSLETLQQVAQLRQPLGLLPFEQREEVSAPYLLAEVSSEGVVTSLRSNYVTLESPEQEQALLELISQAMNAQEEQGILEAAKLRYLRQRRYGGWRLVFLDRSFELATLHSLLQLLVLVGFLSVGGSFGLSLGLAYWATKPVERAWQQQRQFVADASHELKTPLTVILSNADLLLEHGDDPPQLTQRRLSNVRAEAARMKGLVEDLLTLARSDAGRAKTQLEQLCLSELCTDCLLLFEPLAFEQQKELRYQVEEGLYVLGSQNSLRQVLEILLDNALKYSSPQGQIQVTLARSGAKNLRLSVSSSGEPLSPEQCRRVFERFYRADPARSAGGYGLGLSIASALVGELGGKISCQSQEGLNTFTVLLPCLKAKEKAPALPPPEENE